LKQTARIDYATVPYNGAAPVVAALLGNQISAGCAAITPAIPHILAGRLRALAVTTAKRSQALADVPTMAEAGFPGQESDTMQGMLVPAGTPQAIVKKLSADVVKLVTQPEMRERLAGLGFDIVASSPEEFAQQIRIEVARWMKVTQQAGIKVD